MSKSSEFLLQVLISNIFLASLGLALPNPIGIINQAKGNLIPSPITNNSQPKGDLVPSPINNNSQPKLPSLIPGARTQHHLRQIAQAHEFLTAHNKVRAMYGVPPLQWDQRLARFARQHGSKLIGNCGMIHSDGQYGENLIWGKLDTWTPTRMVEDWANEAQYFDRKLGKCTMDWRVCGHFTQIIWVDTLRVGCQRLKCVGEGQGYIGICNYDPPGNFDNQNPVLGKNTLATNKNVSPSPILPQQKSP